METESLEAVAGLSRVVQLQEGIKSVVRGAEQITNEAINAMLRAKKVGDHALGFGAATAELRRFSARLSATMDELTDAIGRQVSSVAALRRDERTLAYQRRALASVPAGSAVLQNVIERMQRSCDAGRSRVTEGQRRLNGGLRQAEKLCRIGLSVARAAKIEAVYGGAMAAGLRQVSDAIEAHVEDLLATVKRLLRGTQLRAS